METHRGKLLKNYGDIGERRNIFKDKPLVSKVLAFRPFLTPKAAGFLDFMFFVNFLL